MDNVNHPTHYLGHPSGIECIELVEHLDFCTGNALKYVYRGWENSKGSGVEDLQKAIWYMRRRVEYWKTATEKQRDRDRLPEKASDVLKRILDADHDFARSSVFTLLTYGIEHSFAVAEKLIEKRIKVLREDTECCTESSSQTELF